MDVDVHDLIFIQQSLDLCQDPLQGFPHQARSPGRHVSVYPLSRRRRLFADLLSPRIVKKNAVPGIASHQDLCCAEISNHIVLDHVLHHIIAGIQQIISNDKVLLHIPGRVRFVADLSTHGLQRRPVPYVQIGLTFFFNKEVGYRRVVDYEACAGHDPVIVLRMQSDISDPFRAIETTGLSADRFLRRLVLGHKIKGQSRVLRRHQQFPQDVIDIPVDRPAVSGFQNDHIRIYRKSLEKLPVLCTQRLLLLPVLLPSDFVEPAGKK